MIRTTNILGHLLTMLLVAYILIGILKYAFTFFEIEFPLDVTVLCAAGIIIICGLFFINRPIDRLRLSKEHLLLVLLVTLSVGWMAITTLWSSADSYKYNKLFGLGTGLFFIILPFTSSQFSLKTFIQWYVGVLLVSSWLYLYAMLNWRIFPTYYDIRGIYLYFSKMLGSGLLFVIFGSQTILKWSSVKTTLVLFIGIITMLALGARGPILLLVLTLLIIGIKRLFEHRVQFPKFSTERRTLILVLLFVSVLIPAIAVLTYQGRGGVVVTRSAERFQLLFEFLDVTSTGDGGKSIINRVEFLSFAIAGIFNDVTHFLFGYGFGSFGVEYSGQQIDLYPHNIILDAWFEQGLVGLILFIIAFGYAFKLLAKSSLAYLFVPLVIFEMLNFMKSGSFTDMRIFVLYFVIALGLPHKQLGLQNKDQD